MAGLLVELRKAPFPYRSMLAIASDLDETPDRTVYWEIMRFLNTARDTAMGPGVGLEVGNSIYFDMAPGQFAYWNSDDRGREMVRLLVRSGHVDCLHSYGDLAVTRAHAQRALEELDRHGLSLRVWIDHAVAPTNFGAGIMRGHGDEVGHPAYHADLTLRHGIQYVWRGRVTSVIGQDARPSLDGLWNARQPAASGRTLAKEALKGLLGRLRHPKYRMHGPNRLLAPARLRDGSPVHEFLRFNPHWGGVSSCDTGREIGEVLTPAVLGRLAARQSLSILYTHLGKVRDPAVPFDAAGTAGLRSLAEASRDGRILVTTTRRLLDYRRMWSQARWTSTLTVRAARIDLQSGSASPVPLSPDEKGPWNGLTFYVPHAQSARMTLDGREVPFLRRNGPDHTGRESISLPWPPLEFPPDDAF